MSVCVSISIYISIYLSIYLYIYIYIYISGRWCEQGSLAYCSPRGCKESNTAWWLNNTTNIYIYIYFPRVSDSKESACNPGDLG